MAERRQAEATARGMDVLLARGTVKYGSTRPYVQSGGAVP